ncbi:MAG: murein L,D-transpeptidase catalytic domain family protein [Hyphomonas sp.]
MMRFVAVLVLFCAYPLAEAETEYPLNTVRADLLAAAQASLQTHADNMSNHDEIVIVDYSLHSAKNRLFVADLKTGTVRRFRVAHGRGSDKDHDGLLDHFSSISGSNASPEGAHVTAEQYVGKHGTSVRMDGLEPSNASARSRAIVIHAASYAEPSMINKYGKLGRSQGCLALSKRDLDTILDLVPTGTLVYISK